MEKSFYQDLPIRHKIAIAEDLAEALHLLHSGQRSSLDLTIEDMKAHSLFLPPEIQQDVLILSEHLQFQGTYDMWHRVDNEVRKAADRLIDDLGFFVPPPLH